MVKVAYQGISGSYSQQACGALFTDTSTRLIPCDSFERVFVTLRDGTADYAVIPIENSLGGSIHLNYDLLEEHEINIIREYNLSIRHCLLGTPGSSLKTIRTVASHPQALHQCRHNLSKRGYKPVPAEDTAGSAKALAELADPTQAAIASRLAGDLYGLQVLQDNFEDNTNNFTRFLVIAMSIPEPTNNDSVAHKTSIVVGVNNSPGALHKVLTYFSLQNIDLTKIESRPDTLLTGSNISDNNPFQYKFYLDFVTTAWHQSRILQNLADTVSYLRLLGTYTTDDRIHVPVSSRRRTKMGIIGFGRFGQFVAEHFANDYDILVSSRSDYRDLAHQLGYSYYSSLTELVQQQVDYIVVCVSIGSFQTVITKLVDTGLLTNELIIDVLSVKEHPHQVLLNLLPPSCDILLTHPMFGPDSCKDTTWKCQPMVYYPVRISDQKRTDNFLASLDKTQLIKMLPATHDKLTANSQCLSHFIGRSLSDLGLATSPIDTNSYKSLCHLTKVTENDSQDLFFGLLTYNKYAGSVLLKFMDSSKKILQTIQIDTE